jgi:putative membrane protein
MDALFHSIGAAALFAALGIVIFVVAFMLIDRLTPGSMWQEIIEKNNTALAIMMAGIAIGISVIIAAAVH